LIFFKQLYDWLVVNKLAVRDLLKSYDAESTGMVETEDFFSCLSGMGKSLDVEHKTKLLATYDKKKEGKINFGDLLSDHKYIHAVRC